MKCGHVLKPDEVQAIRDDIFSIIRPSWLTSVPAQLGSAQHGKLKADQWRVLGTTFLPLTLIRLWHASDGEDDDGRPTRCARILDITLSLLSAITIALSHTTTYSHVDIMQQHLLNYLHGLKELFPDYTSSVQTTIWHSICWSTSSYMALFIHGGLFHLKA